MPTSRLQLALNVTDLELATRFYAELFGVEPQKQRPGYANADDVIATTSRFKELGLQIRNSEQEMCCNAVQDAVYVTAPDVPLGQWEFYTVLDDNPDDSIADASESCCPRPQTGDSPCCT